MYKVSYKMSPQVVLVTGCVSGIGLTTATRLARDPDQRFLVIATVISLELKGDLVAAVGDALDKTVFVKKMDITQDEDISSVVSEIIEKYEQIDIVLNIAGTASHGYLDTMSRSQIELVFNINTLGIIRLTQAVLPHMKQRKAGKIVAISSKAGRSASPLLEIYSSSKFAIEGFFESLAPVARQSNVWISLVEPDFVKTGLMDVIVDDFVSIEADESINDIDRGCARMRVKGCENYSGLLTASDVVDTLVEVLNAEKPVLRYPVPRDLADHFATVLADSTGETAVAIREKSIKAE